MTNEKVTVKVIVTGTPEQPIFSFVPEEVVLTQVAGKVTYQLDDKAGLGLLFAGAVFPVVDQHPSDIARDITSFKVKAAGTKLVLKDTNEDAGTIGLCLLLTNNDGQVFKTQDPQVKNEPTK